MSRPTVAQQLLHWPSAPSRAALELTARVDEIDGDDLVFEQVVVETNVRRPA